MTWTPDSQYLIYGAQHPTTAIWIVPAAGGTPRRLGAEFDGYLANLTVSPDGKQLGFDLTSVSAEFWTKEVFPR